jgi:hypothetical protein
MKISITALAPGALAALLLAGPAFADATKVKVPEGTEMLIRFDDHLSSATSHAGDSFSISLDDDVKLADGTILRAGYRGKGEVTDADKKGMMGKAGTLNVRLDYLRIGDDRVRLRGSRGQEGKSSIGATVALSVLFGPLGLIKHGHDIEIAPGQTITAFVDNDAELTMPLAAAPN